jgi:hypothetical protein
MRQLLDIPIRITDVVYHLKHSVCIARITPNPKGAKDFAQRSTNDDLPTEALWILHTFYGGWVEPTLHT